VSFEVFTALLMKAEVFWHKTVWQLAFSYRHFRGIKKLSWTQKQQAPPKLW